MEDGIERMEDDIEVVEVRYDPVSRDDLPTLTPSAVVLPADRRIPRGERRRRRRRDVAVLQFPSASTEVVVGIVEAGYHRRATQIVDDVGAATLQVPHPRTCCRGYG
jgi:hypothetical protein